MPNVAENSLSLQRFWNADETFMPTSHFRHSAHTKFMDSSTAKKICAKFNGETRWGIGLIFERTCSLACSFCRGMKACRLFAFPAHYKVMLMSKDTKPQEKVSNVCNDAKFTVSS